MADAEIIRLDARQPRPAATEEPERCRAVTKSGTRCRNRAATPDGLCGVHAQQPAGTRADARPASRLGPQPLHYDPQGFETFFRNRARGEYPIDDFGYDPALSREILMPLMRPLYERYFRVRTLGVERIPSSGPALMVGNHSGTIALDAVVVQYAVASEHPEKRAVRNIGADLVWRLPVVGHMARKTGNAVACEEDAQELLRRGELVGVYPEGYKGVGKGWRDRYKLQRFGRGGFIETALRARVPIVPVAVVGAEEAYPMLGNASLLAKALGVPYFPITPTFPLLGPLGLLPLPSRWVIEFGDPISLDDYPEDAHEDAMLVFDLADRVRDIIQQMLYRNLARRGPAFF